LRQRARPTSACTRSFRRCATLRLSATNSRSAVGMSLAAAPATSMPVPARTHQQGVILRAVRSCPPCPTRGFEPASPAEELALAAINTQLAPPADTAHALPRHRSRRPPRRGDEQTVRIIGKLADQPHSSSENSERSARRRVVPRPHDSDQQVEDTPNALLGFRMPGQEALARSTSTPRDRSLAPGDEARHRRARSSASMCHREDRKVSGSAPASLVDSRQSAALMVRKAIGLETGGEKLGRSTYHLTQFRLAQRWHIDLSVDE